MVISANQPQVSNVVRSRIPTEYGEFLLYYYRNTIDDKEHIAMVKGDVSEQNRVAVRIHSECFTGDVLGSRRCDCRDQLQSSMHSLGEAECGVLIYLRQEGRGIGLLEKLKAYNLQDQGFDTVDANIELGHQPDERNYQVAALILQDLKVLSVRLMTNNPTKISELGKLGIRVDDRIPIEGGHHMENTRYLTTKAEKMSHMLSLNRPLEIPNSFSFLRPLVDSLRNRRMIKAERRPLVTVSYAQSIDGSIASRGSDSLALSCHKSLEMTHFLRSQHDGLLVGINTVLIDNPLLTVRHFEGPNPQPIILDSLLRFPENARMLEGDSPAPVILTTEEAPEDRKQKLESLGISVVRVKSNTHHRVDLMDALDIIATLGFTSIMVEGGGSIIGQFLGQEFADYCIVTIAPRLIGGLKAVEDLHRPPEAAPLVIENCEYQCLGSDMIAFGELKTRT